MTRKKLINGIEVDFTTDEETARDIVDQEHQNNLINIKLEQLRNKGNQLLNECDWTQLSDIPTETKAIWTEYRQSLRDITNQTNPFDIVWPVKP